MLGIGIIGCGAIFGPHIQAVKKDNNAKLIAVCDKNKEKAMQMASQYNCKGYTHYSQLIKDEDIQIIHICTPHFLHYDMIKEAIEANKHVLCEKPILMNMEEVGKMEQLLSTSSVKCGVVFQNRYNQTSKKIKEYIQNNQLGSIKGIRAFITWNRDESYYTQSDWRGVYKTEGGGLLINQAIHTLDLMQWFGGEMDWIKGSINTRLLEDIIEVEDTAEATIQYKNGAIGLFYGSNNYTLNSPIELEVVFERGTLRIFNNRLYLMDHNGMKEVGEEDKAKGAKDYWGASHEILISNFYKDIIGDKKTYIDLKEGSKAIEMIDGIRYSNCHNKRYYFGG